MRKSLSLTPRPSEWSINKFLVFGIVFHLIYSWSIFDIYFRSPLVHGMETVDPPLPAPASRLILFIGKALNQYKGLFFTEENVSFLPLS